MDVCTQERIPNVLTIAGIDPSGGAGLIADVKAISALGVYAAGVPTALTAQNTLGVQGVLPIPAAFVKEELDSVFCSMMPKLLLLLLQRFAATRRNGLSLIR